MEWFVRAFIRSSMGWLCGGVTLGLAMVIRPEWTVYRTAHMHMLLLGFVSMMIFGFGYHVVPRLAGNRLYRSSWAATHVWVANAGLAALTIGFMLRAGAHASGEALLIGGGSASALGAYLFAANVLLSTRARGRPVERAAPAGTKLPTLVVSD